MNTAMSLADAKCFTSCCAGVRMVSFAHPAAPWTSAKLLGWLGCETFPVAEGLSQ